jgi:hypothetical protein
MTDTPVPNRPPPRPDPAPPAGRRAWGKVWSAAQLLASLAVAGGVLAYLLLTPASPPAGPGDADKSPPEVVRPAGPHLIRIEPGSKLEGKLQITPVLSRRITSPVMTVSGTVAASLRPGKGKGGDYWQFNAPEVLTAFTDYQKAVADIAFAEEQLKSVKKLAEARVEAQKKVVARLEQLVTAGTDTPKDLAAEQTNLIQYQIQGRKEVHEAETAVRVANRNEAALARQLQQVGLDPDLLKSVTSDVDLVMADVPEGALSRVKKDQGCVARFFGLPDEVFTGKVNSIAPVISKERRSLRVLFVIEDLKDQLRPGMFAEIGLGTDPREALLLPADGVIHIGSAEYVLVAAGGDGLWRVAEVQVGEPHGADVEALAGVKLGERVIGKGAILLKPAVAKALQAANGNGTRDGRPAGGDR